MDGEQGVVPQDWVAVSSIPLVYLETVSTEPCAWVSGDGHCQDRLRCTLSSMLGLDEEGGTVLHVFNEFMLLLHKIVDRPKPLLS